MKKNLVAYGLLAGSALLASGSIVFQHQLTIFSFLLLFYLLPLLLFSVGISLLQMRGIFSKFRALMGGIVFTLVYTLSYFTNIIDFQGLVSASNIEGVSVDAVNMDLSAVANTFVTVVVITWLASFFVNRLSMKKAA